MKLLINADDLGYCNDTDEGIFKTLSHGFALSAVSRIVTLTVHRCGEKY